MSFPKPEDVNTPILDPGDIVSFEEPYRAEFLIPCCIESCRQDHRRGRFVFLASGELSRIGHDCAEREMGTARYNALKHEFDQREQRALRQEIIPAPDFDPAAAFAVLFNSWNERLAIIRRIQANADNDLWQEIETAVIYRNGWVSIPYDDGVVARAKFKSTDFLRTAPWEYQFKMAMTETKEIINLWKKQFLTDYQLKDVRRMSIEVVRRLRVAAGALEKFDDFYKSLGIILRAIPEPLPPFDKTPLLKLMPAIISDNANAVA